MLRYRVNAGITRSTDSVCSTVVSLCRPTVGAQLHRRGAATVQGDLFARGLRVQVACHAAFDACSDVPAVDDEAADGAAEQHASRPMLNIDLAVSAAVERQFEQRSAEMVAQMMAAIESREARSLQSDSGPPAATNMKCFGGLECQNARHGPWRIAQGDVCSRCLPILCDTPQPLESTCSSSVAHFLASSP